MTSPAAALIDRLAETGRASRQELAQLLICRDAFAIELYRAADAVRAKAVGDEVHLRALVEFSNHCRRNCLYCGLRRRHRALHRYRMSPEEIVATALEAAGRGYRTVVLQSGEDLWYTSELLAAIIREIKEQADTAVTLSIGERSEHDYRLLREAGADRFLLRIETSSPALYHQLHPDSGAALRSDETTSLRSASWHQRRSCLTALRDLGYQVGSGVMIGLPSQTTEMLADDLLFLQSLDLDMIGVGPFIPHPATPLAGAVGATLGQSLRFIACLRLLCPEALIPATTALGALHPEGQQQALQAGANVLMPNCTPVQHREHYQLYPGKICIGDSASECRSSIEAMVAALGRRVALDAGHSLRRQRAAVAGTS